ncbi:hypothetical protein [Leptolyngbya sp. 7M]|nr:hypothetical protein [Leptolyngbya sp. 7M]QYO68904.1 hypothetical protein JVX88_28020 [Leptolyngbya sp. 7M]
MTPAVLIEKLQKRYGAVEAVKDVSLQVEPGSQNQCRACRLRAFNRALIL